MPLHRLFPTEKRFKMTFDRYKSSIYVYVDSLGGWNVDTRYLSPELRQWIEDSFETLFNLHFPELIVPDILGAYDDELYGMFLLHVTLTKDVRSPALVLSYYDKQLVYSIPERRVKGVATTCDNILDDLV